MKSTGLHVLMAEADSAPARQVADALTEAGHAVHPCHDRDEVGLACAALRGRGCPLEDRPVDIAVLVRPRTRPEPTLVEQGALCAARRRIPLVVGGAVGADPYRQWAAAEQEGTALLELVEAAAAAPLPEHSEVARATLEETLQTAASSVERCDAEVYRHGGVLQVVLHAEPDPGRLARQVAATRVHQRLRAIDRWTPRMELSFDSRPGAVELDHGAGLFA